MLAASNIDFRRRCIPYTSVTLLVHGEAVSRENAQVLALPGNRVVECRKGERQNPRHVRSFDDRHQTRGPSARSLTVTSRWRNARPGIVVLTSSGCGTSSCAERFGSGSNICCSKSTT